MLKPCCLCSQCWGGPQRYLHRLGPAAAADEAGEGGGHLWRGLHLADEPLPDDSDAGKSSALSSLRPTALWHKSHQGWQTDVLVDWSQHPNWSPACGCVVVLLKAVISPKTSSAGVEIALLWGSPAASWLARPTAAVGHTLPTGYHTPLYAVCTVQDCSTLFSAFVFQSQYIFLHSCILDKILEEPLLGLSGTET